MKTTVAWLGLPRKICCLLTGASSQNILFIDWGFFTNILFIYWGFLKKYCTVAWLGLPHKIFYLLTGAWTASQNILLCSTLGERNPSLELAGILVSYKPRIFEIFCSWTAIWTPLLVLQGPASFSNLADLGLILVMAVHGCCTWLVADIATILSCLCQHSYQMS